MNKVKVKFFGAFRKYIPDGESEIEIAGTVTSREFREILQAHLKSNIAGFDNLTLLKESAIANEDRVLTDIDLIDGSSLVAILPPVCGG
jgi:molybdopterin converting factor small subunit